MPDTPEIVVAVEGASRKFCRDLRRSLRYAVADAVQDLLVRRRSAAALRPGEFWALRDVSFQVRRGESLAVMGLNGAAKSTLLKLVLGSLRLTEGTIVTRGRVAALTEHGLGFDAVLSGRENVYMVAAVLDIDRRRVDAAFDEIVAYAELEAFIDAPVRTYSAGMRARLGFSIAMYLEPDVLLVDEVLAVGDIGFQRRCIAHAQRYLARGGSLLLVSHNPHLVQFLCDRCLVLHHGVLVFDGDAVHGVARYLEFAQAAPREILALDPALAGRSSPAFEALPDQHGLTLDDFGIVALGPDGLRTGAPARIHVRYRAAANLNVRWGFSLLTSDLQTTIACDGPPEPLPLAAGVGELTGAMPRVPLAAGRYALRVAIMDADTALPFALGGFHDAPRYFTIESAVSPRNNDRRFAGDLVVLDPLAWEQHAIPVRA